jgi:hypothetical protein
MECCRSARRANAVLEPHPVGAIQIQCPCSTLISACKLLGRCRASGLTTASPDGRSNCTRSARDQGCPRWPREVRRSSKTGVFWVALGRFRRSTLLRCTRLFSLCWRDPALQARSLERSHVSSSASLLVQSALWSCQPAWVRGSGQNRPRRLGPSRCGTRGAAGAQIGPASLLAVQEALSRQPMSAGMIKR